MTKVKSASPKILIADDEPQMCDLISLGLNRIGFSSLAFQSGKKLLEVFAENDEVQLVLLDMRMPELDGLECLKRCKELKPDVPVIMISGSDEIDRAVQAMKWGALDYVKKPFDLEYLGRCVRHGLGVYRLTRENTELRLSAGGAKPITGLVGTSEVIQKIRSQIEKLARVDSNILITGESGVGKSFIARTIHYSSKRAKGPFVAASCPSLPGELVESELFGHERGAFTGAHQQRLGRVELADKGSLFLDEIGDLPLMLQPKILTFLQERFFQRVGDSKDIHVDVRVMAATNFDLKELVRTKQFREDLYYRLNVVPLHLPPLRDRREDIEPLAEHILLRLAAKQKAPSYQIAPEALEKLLSYSWPGNIRELENVLERGTVFAKGQILNEDSFPEEIMVPSSHIGEPVAIPQLAGLTLDEVERLVLDQTLALCGGNKVETARKLGISEKTVYNLMARYRGKGHF